MDNRPTERQLKVPLFAGGYGAQARQGYLHGRKTILTLQFLENCIPIKFHENPSSVSGKEVENVKC